MRAFRGLGVVLSHSHAPFPWRSEALRRLSRTFRSSKFWLNRAPSPEESGSVVHPVAAAVLEKGAGHSAGRGFRLLLRFIPDHTRPASLPDDHSRIRIEASIRFVGYQGDQLGTEDLAGDLHEPQPRVTREVPGHSAERCQRKHGIHQRICARPWSRPARTPVRTPEQLGRRQLDGGMAGMSQPEPNVSSSPVSSSPSSQSVCLRQPAEPLRVAAWNRFRGPAFARFVRFPMKPYIAIGPDPTRTSAARQAIYRRFV